MLLVLYIIHYKSPDYYITDPYPLSSSCSNTFTYVAGAAPLLLRLVTINNKMRNSPSIKTDYHRHLDLAASIENLKKSTTLVLQQILTHCSLSSSNPKQIQVITPLSSPRIHSTSVGIFYYQLYQLLTAIGTGGKARWRVFTKIRAKI